MNLFLVTFGLWSYLLFFEKHILRKKFFKFIKLRKTKLKLKRSAQFMRFVCRTIQELITDQLAGRKPLWRLNIISFILFGPSALTNVPHFARIFGTNSPI